MNYKSYTDRKGVKNYSGSGRISEFLKNQKKRYDE